MAQVFGNLFHNARKFTGAGGVVTFSVRQTGNSATIKVSDTGIGMDTELLAHAFECFNQAEQSLARSRGGLGLGLALTKGLIELHGGTVRADSEGAGKGTCITLSLPLDQSTVAGSASASPEQPAASRRVLVIEDNVDAAGMLKLMLRHFGHQPAVAYSGQQGLETAHEFHPDIVLCDIGLPDGMDGYAVAQAIRADPQLRGTHLIALTGYSQEEDVQRARAAGFNLHLTKPVDPDKLEKILGSAQLAGADGQFDKR